MNITKSIISPILNFIYPPVCICCNTLLADNENKVCETCWNSIPVLTAEHPLYKETKSKIITEGHINDLISCFIFEKDGTFQHIAHALKYKEFKSIGITLGRFIGQKIFEANYNVDVIIPIPLHKTKYRERGYNQAEYIANGISSIISKPVINDVLKRTRYTQTQTKLSLPERKKNMENAFKIVQPNSDNLKNKICLLVDDVITSGSTINSCAKELKSAGTKAIIATAAALAK